jgi:hypothetical protein
VQNGEWKTPLIPVAALRFIFKFELCTLHFDFCSLSLYLS